MKLLSDSIENERSEAACSLHIPTVLTERRATVLFLLVAQSTIVMKLKCNQLNQLYKYDKDITYLFNMN